MSTTIPEDQIKRTENLIELKNAIIRKSPDLGAKIEKCYFDFLSYFSYAEANIFVRVLGMVEEKSKRVKEIEKVIDLVRFPFKRGIRNA